MTYVILAIDPKGEFPARILTRSKKWGTPGYHMPEVFDTRQDAEDELKKHDIPTRRLIVKEGGY